MSGAIEKFFKPVIYLVSKEYQITSQNYSIWRPFLFGNRVILSRGLCNFDLNSIHPDQARPLTLKAVDLQIRSFSPYKNAGTFIRLDTSHAQVWSWDADPLIARGIPIRNCVPESILHSTNTGIVEIEGIDGFEGQVWSNQGLRVSRWWADKPTDQNWAIFASASERFIDDFGHIESKQIKIEDNIGAKHSKETRGSLPPNRYASLFDFKEWRTVILAIVVAPFLFQIGRAAHFNQSAKSLRLDIADLQETLGTKRGEISTVQRLISTFDSHLETLVYPDPLPGLINTAEILAPLDAKLVRLRLSDQTLSVDFKANTNFDQVKLVKNLEASPFLEDAVVTPGRGRNDWTAEGRLKQPLALTTAPED